VHPNTFFLIVWVTACERDFVNWPPPQKEYYKCLVWCFGWLQKVVGLILWKSPNNFYTEHLDVFVGHRTVGLFSWKSSNNFYTEHFDVFFVGYGTVGLFSWKLSNNFYTEHFGVFVDHKTIELLSWKLPNNLYAEYFYVLLEFLARQIVDLNFSKKLKHLFSCVKSWSKDR